MKSDEGITVWFTGLSGAGKTTLSYAVRESLRDMEYTCLALDGDVVRQGLNSDLGFTAEDRAENIRRMGEIAKLTASNGVIVLASFISPYIAIRDRARKLHQDNDITFVECHVSTSLETCEARDVKGLYKKARAGIIPNFTGVSDPYEIPPNPELTIDTTDQSLDDCVKQVVDYVLDVLSTKDDSGSETMDIMISDLDKQWVQVIAEGWASPLDGFMSEDQYLQCLHFGHISIGDPDDKNMSCQTVPIVLPITTEIKESLDHLIQSGNRYNRVNLVHGGVTVASMDNLSVYEHRKEERCSRQWGINNPDHPHIKMIHDSGDWLLGGKFVAPTSDTMSFQHVDGLDQYRLTPSQLQKRFEDMGADCVYAFQLRNPIHNGHALLMKDTRQQLLDEGYKNPVLLLHPLGGWTKQDDVPLDVRMRQHQVLLDGGVLPPNTVLAIFPSPMLYGGPTEVQWHAKARQNAGATHYIVGRDPAGMNYPNTGKSIYNHSHGKRVLAMSPYLDIDIIPFKFAAYDTSVNKMAFFDPARKDDFLPISGSKMRQYARDGESPPDGFMNPKAWQVLVDYYSRVK